VGEERGLVVPEQHDDPAVRGDGFPLQPLEEQRHADAVGAAIDEVAGDDEQLTVARPVPPESRSIVQREARRREETLQLFAATMHVTDRPYSVVPRA
jgi:hypothetical protein